MSIPAPNDPPSSSATAADDLHDLLPTVYDELHSLAAAILVRNRVIDPTRTTSLVQDVYVRLAHRGVKFRDRSHFLCLAARAMRMVLIDRIRRSSADKRGGNLSHGPLDESAAGAPHLADCDGPDLLALDDALRRLAEFDPRKSRIIELRYFGALSVEEAATVLNISPATLKREWTLARAWLYREIGGDGELP